MSPGSGNMLLYIIVGAWLMVVALGKQFEYYYYYYYYIILLLLICMCFAVMVTFTYNFIIR